MNPNVQRHSVRIDGKHGDTHVTGGIDYPLTEFRLVSFGTVKVARSCAARSSASLSNNSRCVMMPLAMSSLTSARFGRGWEPIVLESLLVLLFLG